MKVSLIIIVALSYLGYTFAVKDNECTCTCTCSITTSSTTTPTPTTSTETTTNSRPTSCEEAFNQTGRYGAHEMQCGDQILSIICLQGGDKDTGERNVDSTRIEQWVVIQRRMDGTENFNRNWADYKKGFGDINSDFWIGLDTIHALTKSTKPKLWIKLKDFENGERSGIYTDFSIGDENEAYKLKSLGNFFSKYADFQDSLIENHLNQKFSTWDRDNDNKPEYSCAEFFSGGWWFNKCHDSHLNGLYLHGQMPKKDPKTNKTNRGHGISWKNWRLRYYSYKYAHMAIKFDKQTAENYCAL